MIIAWVLKFQGYCIEARLLEDVEQNTLLQLLHATGLNGKRTLVFSTLNTVKKLQGWGSEAAEIRGTPDFV